LGNYKKFIICFKFHVSRFKFQKILIHYSIYMLSKRQQEILRFITSYLTEYGFPPSYQEIADNFKLSSRATVHEHVQSLREKGYLTLKDGAKRSLEPTKKFVDFAKSVFLPFVGTITAGQPIQAIEEKETMAVPAELIKDPLNTYVLRVKGSSMIEDGIFNGDHVIIERNPSPKNGDVVVALLNNEYATLKKFYREKDRIRLQPANSSMKPIYVKDVNIQGIVKAVIRKF